MRLSKKGRWVYCYECGSRKEKNGVCHICGHVDEPLLAGMVPDLVGLTQAEAGIKLIDPECQLILGNITTANSETVAVDLIISSAPNAGVQLNIGDSVDIVVSLGPVG